LGGHGGGQGLFSVFEVALPVVAPWQVTSVEFDKDAGEQQIGLGFPRGHGSWSGAGLWAVGAGGA